MVEQIYLRLDENNDKEALKKWKKYYKSEAMKLLNKGEAVKVSVIAKKVFLKGLEQIKV